MKRLIITVIFSLFLLSNVFAGWSDLQTVVDQANASPDQQFIVRVTITNTKGLYEACIDDINVSFIDFPGDIKTKTTTPQIVHTCICPPLSTSDCQYAADAGKVWGKTYGYSYAGGNYYSTLFILMVSPNAASGIHNYQLVVDGKSVSCDIWGTCNGASVNPLSVNVTADIEPKQETVENSVSAIDSANESITNAQSAISTAKADIALLPDDSCIPTLDLKRSINETEGSVALSKEEYDSALLNQSLGNYQDSWLEANAAQVIAEQAKEESDNETRMALQADNEWLAVRQNIGNEEKAMQEADSLMNISVIVDANTTEAQILLASAKSYEVLMESECTSKNENETVSNADLANSTAAQAISALKSAIASKVTARLDNYNERINRISSVGLPQKLTNETGQIQIMINSTRQELTNGNYAIAVNNTAYIGSRLSDLETQARDIGMQEANGEQQRNLLVAAGIVIVTVLAYYVVRRRRKTEMPKIEEKRTTKAKK